MRTFLYLLVVKHFNNTCEYVVKFFPFKKKKTFAIGSDGGLEQVFKTQSLRSQIWFWKRSVEAKAHAWEASQSSSDCSSPRLGCSYSLFFKTHSLN